MRVLCVHTQALLTELHALASTSASAERGICARAQNELLSLPEWKALLHALHLMGTDLSEVNATLAFAWSRMVVIDNSTAKGRARESHLPPEGLCEALCYVATLKALPTDADIAAAGSRNAGAFLDELKARDALAHADFLHERRIEWGAQPSQPPERSVAHLMQVILHRLNSEAGGLDPTSLVRWWKNRRLT